MTTFNNDITYQALSRDDIHLFRKMINMFCGTFEEWPDAPASDERLKQLLNSPDFIAIAAMSGGQPAGGVTAYVMDKYYSDSKEAYLYDMAVHTAYQRQGIGLKLIQALKEACKAKNVTLVFVEAEAEDTHAVNFYKKAGGKLTEVAHFDLETGIEN